MEKWIVLGLVVCALAASADAHGFGGFMRRMRDRHRHRHGHGKEGHHGATNNMAFHKAHMKRWMRMMMQNVLRPGPDKAEMSMRMLGCHFVQTSFPAQGSVQLQNLWPGYFADVKNAKACQRMCYSRPWACGAYVVNSPVANGPSQCILYLRSKAGQMGASYTFPSAVTSAGKFYELRRKGVFLTNDALLKMGQFMLMKRMPLMLSKVGPIMDGVKKELGLQEPLMSGPDANDDTDKPNPFAGAGQTGTPESVQRGEPEPSPGPPAHAPAYGRRRRHHHPGNLGPPPPGFEKHGHGEAVTGDATVAASASDGPRPTFDRKPEPGETVVNGGVDAPEAPKRGPGGAPAGWKPGQEEEGTGWKRSQERDPELGGPPPAPHHHHHHGKHQDADQ